MNVRDRVRDGPSTRGLDVHVHDESLFIDVFVSFTDLVFDSFFGQFGTVDERQRPICYFFDLDPFPDGLPTVTSPISDLVNLIRTRR